MTGNLITVTQNASEQIRKIINSSEKKCVGVKVGVDKTGCSGYAYKIDYATAINSAKCDLIETKDYFDNPPSGFSSWFK